MSIYQIAKAGHRPQEHLFVVKSLIALYVLLQIPLFLQFFDISKFFDSESLRDGMNTVYKAGISGKLYRLWYKLNAKTNIGVQTGFGVSKYKHCNETIAQGSFGGAIISAANLDDGIQELFEDSQYEVSYGSVLLKPLLYQDDIFLATKATITTTTPTQTATTPTETTNRMPATTLRPTRMPATSPRTHMSRTARRAKTLTSTTQWGDRSRSSRGRPSSPRGRTPRPRSAAVPLRCQPTTPGA